MGTSAARGIFRTSGILYKRSTALPYLQVRMSFRLLFFLSLCENTLTLSSSFWIYLDYIWLSPSLEINALNHPLCLAVGDISAFVVRS